MKSNLMRFFIFLTLSACNPKKEKTIFPISENQTILIQLAENYKQMPERFIVRSPDNRVYAQYAMPTEKYGHGVLGDQIEGQQLVVVVDSVFYEFILPEDYVFEDISPRLFDVDHDGELEFITIRTQVSRGAGIAIFKIVDSKLVEFAFVPEIGAVSRWLNIVAINDIDNDGTIELIWIQTPHIGGVLKVAKIESGMMQALSEKSKYSNHSLGERNLCLSVLTEKPGQKVFYVPDQSGNKIVGFTFKNNALEIFEEISLKVDFSKSLDSQISFGNPLDTGNNCFD